MLKRFFDLAISILLFPLAMFLCICAGLLYYILERENPIFAQQRVGRLDIPFTLYKMRTMKAGTLSVGTHEVDRQSVTKFGRLLRKTKLDELPQLWNVIVGDMSLVGPRPCLPTQSEVIEYRNIRGVNRIRPGITGLAQIQGADMSAPEHLSLVDRNYLENQSMAFDLKIIILTLIGNGLGDRVKKD